MVQGIFSTFLSPFQTITEMDKGLMFCLLVGTELLLGSTWVGSSLAPSTAGTSTLIFSRMTPSQHVVNDGWILFPLQFFYLSCP